MKTWLVMTGIGMKTPPSTRSDGHSQIGFWAIAAAFSVRRPLLSAMKAKP